MFQKVFDQPTELNSLLKKTNENLSPNDSDDNEFDQLIALRSSDIMHNLLDKYQILNKYDDQKSYSESASSDIRSKYMRLENFNFEEGRLSDLVDMAVEKYGFITTRFRRRAWRKLLANQEAQSEKQNFKTISNNLNFKFRNSYSTLYSCQF